ncbi:calcium-dependent protein kinase [Purpureocillium lilacinum]|uniref:non-specific serine/threonine protein kinase n=1 Tax=Purpureocillium lilacinum TaxID=33203 RepID=A0A179H6V9_PURLI|nr:calcium-dependent protein kinase [Purpureocillium lilacinum]OAQ85301.1 calcium-dependent protein kinase [Purpureocillium lilacinum]GJN74678.1 putative serine/threonine-protein kinase iks1 [Purpureocillium lilacinum]
MSLIPYHPREGREIVLRHHSSLVVRDPDSQRLEIRRTECPTCHQPLGRAASPERSFDRQYDMNHEYVNPDYFRMLRAGNHSFHGANGPPSPVRRLAQPALVSDHSRHSTPAAESVGDDAEFLSSAPGVGQAEGSRIRREAFSPNYFKTFFVEETVLGRGGKGVVLLVRHEIDGCQLGHFACKRVPVGDDHAWLEKVLIEVELLAKLSHPNLVSYRHVWLEDVQLTRFGPSVACAFILQQYCNSGDLHQYVVGGAPREATKEELKAQMRRRSKGQAELPRNLLNSRPQLSFEDIYSLFKDVTSGVAYLHAANYIHRDLKPSNCLLHKEGGKMTCLISDFGEVQPENVVRKSTGSTGTISYCAPEVLKMDATGQYGNFTTKSDMFSLGMILYFMCFGRLPYHGANAIQEELEDIDQLRDEIMDWKGFQDERRERPDLPPRLYKLLKKLLSLDPAERPSANEVLTAMRSETNFDGITRGDRTPNSSPLRGIRVQNLDSPVSSGTPVPDPRKERSYSNGSSNDEASAWRKATERESDRVPPPGLAQHRNASSAAAPDSIDFAPRPDHDSHSMVDSSGPLSPPLLLAPPRTRAEEVRYQTVVMFERMLGIVGIRPEFVSYIGRLGLFLLKMVTLGRPCWPYVASLEVSIPLVVVAALDLGLPTITSAGGARRDSQTGDLVSTHIPSAGLGTSMILLAFHFAVLWLAQKWNALCVAVPGDDWADW